MSDIPYLITFYERANPSRRIQVRLGDTAPTPSAGGGGHQIVPLPKRAAVTVWTGRDNIMLMDVPIILGDGPAGAPINLARNELLTMWRPDDPTDEPPVIKLRSPGNAVPFQNLSWVITDLQWASTSGDVQGDEQANRTMQKLTVSLTEFRKDERLQIVKQRKRRKHKHRRTHKVKHGETLPSIARAYDITGGWRAIGDVQSPPIRDPRQITVGQELQIPG